MFHRLKHFFDSFRGEPRPDPLKAVQPRVTPDPAAAAALEKRFSELAYYPENGFHAHRNQVRSNVVPMRRRARWTGDRSS